MVEILTTLEKIRQMQPKYLADNGDLIIKSGWVINGDIVIYTVPANRVLYIVSATITWKTTDTAAGANSYMYYNNKAAILLESTNASLDHDTATHNYSIPVKLTATQTIKIESGAANDDVFGSIVGYEFDA